MSDYLMEFNNKIVNKYLKGKFSLHDKIIVDGYFEDDRFTHELNGLLKKSWDETFAEHHETSEVENKKLNSVLDKINHQILLHSKRSQNILNRIWFNYSKIAAILLFPVILFSLYYLLNTRNNNITSLWMEVHSPYGARTQFSLPDGSVGWLNSGSVLKYPAKFTSIRNVNLKGEAYFKVTKNPFSPFIVTTQDVKVKVLGTEFNIVAYENDSITEVVVASGKVEVNAKSKRFKKELLPAEHLVLNSQKKYYHKSLVDIQNYTSWKDGKLIFANDNLIEVARKVSRYYNVDFEIQNNVNTQQSFRAVLEGENLEELMRYMKLTMPINFIIKERKHKPDGTLSKRKVIIMNAI